MLSLAKVNLPYIKRLKILILRLYNHIRSFFGSRTMYPPPPQCYYYFLLTHSVPPARTAPGCPPHGAAASVRRPASARRRTQVNVHHKFTGS
jgi:hypothetical protein